MFRRERERESRSADKRGKRKPRVWAGTPRDLGRGGRGERKKREARRGRGQGRVFFFFFSARYASRSRFPFYSIRRLAEIQASLAFCIASRPPVARYEPSIGLGQAESQKAPERAGDLLHACVERRRPRSPSARGITTIFEGRKEEERKRAHLREERRPRACPQRASRSSSLLFLSCC